MGEKIVCPLLRRTEPREYPADAGLAEHLTDWLVQRDFDIASADTIEPGKGEGHAFGFFHSRLMSERPIPVVPVFLNT